MPRVLLVGAYERDNLGDLLFLLVTERYLEGAEVVAGAPFSADMRELLDRKVPAYGPLLQAEAFDAIWTVGGQVGRVDLRRAYRMSATPAEWRRFVRSSAGAQIDLMRQATGGVPLVSPYIPLPFAFPRNAGALSVLNSVGIAGVRGIESPRRETIVAALRGATSIVVRDRGSSKLLSDLGIEHRLAPDAVHALSVLHPSERDAGADVAIVQISRSRLRLLGHARWAPRSRAARSSPGGRSASCSPAPRRATTRSTTTSRSSAPPGGRRAVSTSRSSTSAARSSSPRTSGVRGW